MKFLASGLHPTVPLRGFIFRPGLFHWMKGNFFVFFRKKLIFFNPIAVILLNPEVELQLSRSVNVEMTSEKILQAARSNQHK